MPPRRSAGRRAIPTPLAPNTAPRAVSVTLPARSGPSTQQALPLPVESSRQPARFRDLPVVVSCGGCDCRWSGLDAAHCRACHQVWPTVVGFDDHLAECPAAPEIAPRKAKRIPDQRRRTQDGAEVQAEPPAGAAREEWNVA
ncbi:FDXHR family putative zinc-binding protein [Parafrankia colletiae]